MSGGALQSAALKEIEQKILAPRLAVRAETERFTALGPGGLRAALLAGETTLPEVVEAFHARKQREMNVHRALADVFFDGAMEQASALQRALPARADALPLLGFVFSVKDSVLMANTRSTCGLATNYPHVYAGPTPFIDYLREMGALILAKGNVPQALMAMETANNLFGEALHPLDRARTPGGSSGGEAAQLLLRLSNAGLGSDGAGSLRIPALFCGLATLKVTSRRFASPLARLLTVQAEPEDHERIFEVVMGALTYRVADLTAFTRVFNDYNQRSRYLPPLPWRAPRLARRVGVLAELSHCPLPAVCRRALDVCRERLLARGFELVELDFNDVAEELHRTILAVFLKDSLLVEILQRRHHMPEPVLPLYSEFVSALAKPTWLLRLVRRFLAPHRQLVVDGIVLGRTSTIAQLRERVEHFRQHFLDLFAQKGVEVALFGGFPPALRRGTSQHCSLIAVYTFVWNALDFVAGALPVVCVQPHEEDYLASDELFAAALRLSMKGATGLPVGVQVIGLPYTEEDVLELMRVLEEEVKHKSPRVNS